MQTPKWQIPNCKMAQPQTEGNKPIRKRQFSIPRLIMIFVGGFFFLQLLQSQFSTLSVILVGTTVILLVIAMVLSIKRNGKAKLSGKILAAFTIFVIVFGGVGFYLSQFYGPTVPPVGYPEVLNSSLTSYLQTLEQSASFQFIKAEHFGTLTFEDLSIHTTYSNAPQGGVNWDFYAGDTNNRLMVGQSSGRAYYFSSIGYGRGHPLPNYYPSDNETARAFSQIDALGLNWFYNQAVLEYQNSTGHKPNLTALTLDVGYDNVGNYRGITLSIDARRENQDSFGNKIYPLVFEAEFQPDGVALFSKNLPS
jgi:hypothetical protein